MGDLTIDYIDTHKKDPFFVFLSFTAVHTPMQAKKEDLALFERHPRQTLAAMTWAMDRSVGNVLKKLEEEKILENTLIFFLSDNGGSPHNDSSVGPLNGFKGVEFEGGHRVGYAMMWKEKIQGGKTYNEMVSSLDIFATSIAAAGMKKSIGKKLDGVDLVPFVEGRKKGHPHDVLFWRMGRANGARFNNYKYLSADGCGSVLYDLTSDLGETRNIKENKKKLHDKIESKFKEWESTCVDKAWGVSEGWDKVICTMICSEEISLVLCRQVN